MTDVKDLLKEELITELSSLNVERFRAGQMFNWVYKKFVYDFDKMINLPADARNSLKRKFYISEIKLVKELISKDGTRKFLFGLEDEQKIESVFIPSKNTNTVCVSSQVGCKFACKFCASGKGGFVRNLRPAEMINQVLNANLRKSNADLREYSRLSACNLREFALKNVTNVVFMGMGEPFDNYDNVLKAVRILNAPYGLNIGQRKITISTCGIIPGIKKLAKEDLQVELSISLHGTSDEVRSRLMGVNRRYPIKELMAACREYIKETNRQVTFEYVLINGVNDSKEAAEGLANLIKGGLFKVNLIPFNAPHPAPSPQRGKGRPACRIGKGEGEQKYRAPQPKTVKDFKDVLDKAGIVSVIRVTRGQDIEAACGQLRLKEGIRKNPECRKFLRSSSGCRRTSG